MFRKQWVQAGEVAYEVLDRRTDSPNTLGMILGAIRMHARATSDYARATAAIEQVAAVSWSESGAPILRNRPRSATQRSRSAISCCMARIRIGPQAADGDRRAHGPRPARPQAAGYWYYRWHPVALSCSAGAMRRCRCWRRRTRQHRSVTQWWWFLEAEPGYDSLRRDGRFASLRLKVAAHIEEQRRLVERMREDGEVPDRTAQ